jgi:hypothetical protein
MMVDFSEINVLVREVAENLQDAIYTLLAVFQPFQPPTEVKGIHRSENLRASH